MAWLRLDDGFTKHPKFEGWKPAERWAWLEVMEYGARYRTGGRIPTDETLLPRSTTPALLRKAEKSGWCVRGEDGALWINGWEEFNPQRVEDVDEAVSEYLTEHPDASKNEVCRHVRANRKAVLASVDRFRSGTRFGSVVPVPELVTRARSRPVPSSSTEEEPPAAAHADEPDTIAAAARAALERLAIDPGLADRVGPELVLAWVDVADTDARSNPAGFVIAGLRTGRPPTPRTAPDVEEPEDPGQRRRRWIEEWGWRMEPVDAEVHLEEMGAELEERIGLLEHAADIRTRETT